MKKHIGSIAIVSVPAPWRRSRRCPGVQLAGDAFPGRVWGQDGLDELQCDPLGVILDRWQSRASGRRPAAGPRRCRQADGQLALWVSLPQAMDEALGVVPLFVRYGSPSTRASE